MSSLGGSLLNVRSLGLKHVQRASKRTIGKRVHKRTYHAVHVTKYEGKVIGSSAKVAVKSRVKKSKIYNNIDKRIPTSVKKVRNYEKGLRKDYNTLNKSGGKPNKPKYDKYGDRIW